MWWQGVNRDLRSEGFKSTASDGYDVWELRGATEGAFRTDE